MDLLSTTGSWNSTQVLGAIMTQTSNLINYLGYSRSVWGKQHNINIHATKLHLTPSYDFMESIPNQNNHSMEVEEEHVMKMEIKIKHMLDQREGDVEPLMLLELVDDIEHLGLGYKFEESINTALETLESSPKIRNNLHASALYFRLLRQHGYQISTDILKGLKEKFIDEQGMLSLYEASYLALEKEDYLEKGREYTRSHLKKMILIGDVDKKLAVKVRHSLEIPFHHRMSRVEAKWNIEMYDDKQSVTNQMLHKLAVMDFNKVQSLYQHELQEVATWWRRVGLAKELSFARDRVMESLFWSIGMVWEPEFSKCRVGLAKLVLLITVLDDIFDVHGCPQDLHNLTQLVQKWDINAGNDLPHDMKLFFMAFYNAINDLAYQTLKDHHQLVIHQLSEGWADLCKAFLREAEWRWNKEMPRFDEYLNQGPISSSGIVLLMHVYLLMTPVIRDEALEKLNDKHRLLRSSSTIFRLANDLSSYQEEIERGEVKAVSCYMQETGSSNEDARAHMQKLIDQNWKMLNQEITSCENTIFGKSFVRTSCNLARVALCQYQHGDAHSKPSDESRNRVNSVIIHPISVPNF